MIVVFDIDGTIAHGGRRFEAAGPEPDRSQKEAYMKWVDAVQNDTSLMEDEPVPGMLQMVQALAAVSRQAIYLTSREDRWRDTTLRWLRKHGFPQLKLVMRPTGSWANTADFKEASVNALRVHREAVVLVDDDEHGTIEEMSKRNGWTFLKARSGGQK